MTEQTKQKVKENLKPFKRAETYAVTLYNDVIHPLLDAGRKRKHIARLLCSWCGKVLNANYQTRNGLDIHGICDECRDCKDKVLAEIAKDFDRQ
jgi:hypothetical protein